MNSIYLEIVLALSFAMGAEGITKEKTSKRMQSNERIQKTAAATEAIRKKYPNFRPSDFEMKVSAPEDGDRVAVQFSQRLAFIPRDSTFLYTVEWSQEFGVQLTEEFSNQQTRTRKSDLFIPTSESRNAIEFVRKAAKKAGQPFERAQIYDNGIFYCVTTGGLGWDRRYYVDKATGMVTEVSTGTDAEPPNE